jgi:hypothetical protein
VPLRSPISPNYKPFDRNPEDHGSHTTRAPSVADPVSQTTSMRKTSRFVFAQGDSTSEVPFQRSRTSQRGVDLHQGMRQLSILQDSPSVVDQSHLPPYHPLRILQNKRPSEPNPESVDSLFGAPDVLMGAPFAKRPSPPTDSFVAGIPAPPGVGNLGDYRSANEFFSHFLRRASAHSLDESPVDITAAEPKPAASQVNPASVKEETRTSLPEFRDPAIMAIRYSSPQGVMTSTSTSPIKGPFDSPLGFRNGPIPVAEPVRRQDMLASSGPPFSQTGAPYTSNSSTLTSVGMGNYFSSRPISTSGSPHAFLTSQAPFPGHTGVPNSGYGVQHMNTKVTAPFSSLGHPIQPLSQQPSLLPNRATQNLPTAYSHYGSILGHSQQNPPQPHNVTPPQSSRMRLKIFENVTAESSPYTTASPHSHNSNT